MLTPSLLAALAVALPAAASEAETANLAPPTEVAETPAELPESVLEPAPVVEKWIGTLAVLGSRKVPLLGKVEFRTDTQVLATATEEGPVWTVAQKTCRVNFPKVAGAKISLNETAPQVMPIAHFNWVPGEDEWHAGPWGSGWDENDHDGDGNPGITFHVQAPFCGGDIYVSSKASQTARGKPGKDDTVVEGVIDIHVEQNILGARGPCLTLMARDTKEWMRGQFAFVRVEDDATCDSVKVDRFPDPMSEGN